MLLYAIPLEKVDITTTKYSSAYMAVVTYGPTYGPTSKLIPPGKNARRYADDNLRCIFVNETCCILVQISFKFIPKGSIDNKPAFGLNNGLAPNRWQVNAQPEKYLISLVRL